jgi:hypothetical protein
MTTRMWNTFLMKITIGTKSKHFVKLEMGMNFTYPMGANGGLTALTSTKNSLQKIYYVKHM